MHTDKTYPDVVIIGAMKCGTTSLFRQLKKHNEINASSRKEINYYSDNWALGETWYQQWFGKSHGLTLEASTSYTKYPLIKHVPERLFKANPRALLIYMIRHPLDRIVSHVNYNARHYQLKREDVQEESFWTRNSNHFISVSDYYLQLKQYSAYFSKERILIIKLEDYHANPKNELDRVTEFLNIAKFKDKEISDKIFNKSINRTVERSGLVQRLFRYFEKEGAEYLLPVKFGMEYKPIVLRDVINSLIWERLMVGLDHLKSEFGVDHGYSKSNAHSN